MKVETTEDNRIDISMKGLFANARYILRSTGAADTQRPVQSLAAAARDDE